MASTAPRFIRNLSLALPRRGDHVLASLGGDRVAGTQFCRAIGGGIDFGETAAQALVREFREELDLEIRPTKLLGVMENLFEYEGQPGHEIVHVFAVESEAIDALTLDVELSILDEGSPVGWYPINELAAGRPPLYPAGILDLVVNNLGS